MKYILKPIFYLMKYLLILLGWSILTVWLILERTLKLLGLIFLFLWDFKVKKIDIDFLNRYDVPSEGSHYTSLKDFYLLKNCKHD